MINESLKQLALLRHAAYVIVVGRHEDRLIGKKAVGEKKKKRKKKEKNERGKNCDYL